MIRMVQVCYVMNMAEANSVASRKGAGNVGESHTLLFFSVLIGRVEFISHQHTVGTRNADVKVL